MRLARYSAILPSLMRQVAKLPLGIGHGLGNRLLADRGQVQLAAHFFDKLGRVGEDREVLCAGKDLAEDRVVGTRRHHIGIREDRRLCRSPAEQSAPLGDLSRFGPLDEAPCGFHVRARIGNGPAPAAVQATARIGRDADLSGHSRGFRILETGIEDVEGDEAVGPALRHDIEGLVEAVGLRTGRAVVHHGVAVVLHGPNGLGAVQQGIPVLVVIPASLGIEIVSPLHRDAVAALPLNDGSVKVALAVAVVVAREELDLLPVFVPGLGDPEIDSVFLLEGRLFRRIVDQVLAIDHGHRIVVERQHVEHAVDTPDQIHELGDVDVDIDTVAGGEVIQRHQPARLGEFADPVEVDDDQVVASLG